MNDFIFWSLAVLPIAGMVMYSIWHYRKIRPRMKVGVITQSSLWGFQCYFESIGKNLSAMVKVTKRDEAAIIGLAQLNEHFNIEKAFVGNKLTLIVEEIRN